jgi:hypothetical protein
MWISEFADKKTAEVHLYFNLEFLLILLCNLKSTFRALYHCKKKNFCTYYIVCVELWFLEMLISNKSILKMDIFKNGLQVQAARVIRGFGIRGFDYSRTKKPRITRENCQF